MTSSTILVIGSTGKTGRRIVQRLEAAGRSVRHGSRQSTPPFDWEAPATWPAALRGVEAAYVAFFPDLAVPGAPAAIEELTRVAHAAGVRRLVLLSGRGEQNAQRCEAIVTACPIPATLIRASWFAQNFSEGHLVEPVLGGLIALPAGDVREPFVDADDIADVAVAALTDDRHIGALYELTGPRLLSFADAAGELSAAIGREIRYAAITPSEYHAAVTEAAGPELAGMLTDLMAEVLDGRNAHLANGVQEALGRAPRDFADYCKQAAAAGAWSRTQHAGS